MTTPISCAESVEQGAGLLDLATRAEMLSGPDREVDAMIGAAVRQMPQTDPGAFLAAWPTAFQPAKFKGSIAAVNEAGDMVVHWESLQFTASLDAAMSLVPEGWNWTVGTGPEDGYEDYPEHVIAWASLDRGDGAIDLPYANGRTPAIALAAAALRARSSQDQPA